jgi:heme/copper-type cytochrome/quinol oxidase subunit 2
MVFSAAFLIASAVAALSVAAALRTQTEEVRLVAREMAFYPADGSATPNPVIQVRAGQQIRIVLENQDPGIVHDFQVPGLSIAIPAVQGGASGKTALFRAPRQPGRYRYFCSPHAAMMSGEFVVLERN